MGYKFLERRNSSENTSPPQNASTVSTGLGKCTKANRAAAATTAPFGPKMVSRRRNNTDCRMNSCASAQTTYSQDRLHDKAWPAPANRSITPVSAIPVHSSAPEITMGATPASGRVNPISAGLHLPVTANATTQAAAVIRKNSLSDPCGVQAAATMNPRTRAISTTLRRCPGNLSVGIVEVPSLGQPPKEEKNSDFSVIRESSYCSMLNSGFADCV